MPSPAPLARRPWRLAALALLLLPAAGPASAEPGPAAPMDRPQALAALQAPRPAMAAAAPMPGGGGGWGAVYAAASGTGYGLAVNRAGRAEAQAAAEARCRRGGGGGEAAMGCRLVAEFSGRCGAVAQAVDRAVLVSLRPLDSAAILATAAGAGETGEVAGRAALERCGREGGGRGICVVVASACAER
jgi:hypothetical protein